MQALFSASIGLANSPQTAETVANTRPAYPPLISENGELNLVLVQRRGSPPARVAPPLVRG